MSHQPERNEKDCLNCGTLVQGLYCHVCGQANIVTKQNFFSLVKHFVYDIAHFDSKFFDTLKYILFRPGYTPKKYIAGQRARFLDPIRMYLFTSALFFLFFFSLKTVKSAGAIFDGPNVQLTGEDRQEAISELEKTAQKKPGDTAVAALLTRLKDTTQAVNAADIMAIENGSFVTLSDTTLKTKEAYDLTQQKLPPQKRDGWLERTIIHKGFDLNRKYNRNLNAGFKDFSEVFLHKLPYLLFLSLPFFALILKLLYVRRKSFFYSDHAIFTLYHYIFSFILLLLVFLCNLLADWSGYGIFKFLLGILILAWPVYLYIAMKRFYGQGRFKTFSKFLLLNFIGFLVVLLLFIIFVFFTIFQL